MFSFSRLTAYITDVKSIKQFFLSVLFLIKLEICDAMPNSSKAFKAILIFLPLNWRGFKFFIGWEEAETIPKILKDKNIVFHLRYIHSSLN